jgi:hypothetical protein
MFDYVRRWLRTAVVTPGVSSLIERLMREIGRRLKRMAFGWSEDSVNYYQTFYVGQRVGIILT